MANVVQHKAKLAGYFNGVGFKRWEAIYGGQVKLSRVRRTIREGHAAMLKQAESWLTEASLPAGADLLDAGCGTGLFSVAMARRGCQVMAIDLAAQMVEATRAHAAYSGLQHRVNAAVGDLEMVSGGYHAVACFDVLIHYAPADFEHMIGRLARLANGPLLFTYAPRSPLLAALHWVGGRFPASDRRTAIQIVPPALVERALGANGFWVRRTAKITRGFYNVALVEAARR